MSFTKEDKESHVAYKLHKKTLKTVLRENKKAVKTNEAKKRAVEKAECERRGKDKALAVEVVKNTKKFLKEHAMAYKLHKKTLKIVLRENKKAVKNNEAKKRAVEKAECERRGKEKALAVEVVKNTKKFLKEHAMAYKLHKKTLKTVLRENKKVVKTNEAKKRVVEKAEREAAKKAEREAKKAEREAKKAEREAKKAEREAKKKGECDENMLPDVDKEDKPNNKD